MRAKSYNSNLGLSQPVIIGYHRRGQDANRYTEIQNDQDDRSHCSGNHVGRLRQHKERRSVACGLAVWAVLFSKLLDVCFQVYVLPARDAASMYGRIETLRSGLST